MLRLKIEQNGILNLLSWYSDNNCADTLPTHCIDNYASVVHKKYLPPTFFGVGCS